MAKDKITYKVYFSTSGAPTAGLSPTWKNDQWIRAANGKKVNRDSPTDWDATTGRGLPSIKEVGGGYYAFDATLSYDVVGVIDGGSSLTVNTDRYVPVAIGPQDTHLMARSVEEFYLLLKREFENKKTLAKSSDLLFVEKLYNDSGSTVIRTRNISKSGSTETREAP